MPPELQRLFSDLNTEGLRFRRPSKFIFFCGGAMSPIPTDPSSLRQYLLSERKISNRIKADIILAEEANQLYRDTNYQDLISFEEDIARISAMVLLIAESPGSLAELGAFAAIKSIRSNLSVFIRTDHDDAESFVRYGPIEKLRNEDDKRVGVYPWRINKKGKLIKSSASPHVKNMIKFVNGILQRTPSEQLFFSNRELEPFIIILWVLYLGTAMSITELHRYVNYIRSTEIKEIKNILYCMKLSNWVNKYSYENKTYWYYTYNFDPISRYSFNADAVSKDPTRRKSEVSNAIGKDLSIPRHVLVHISSQKDS